MRELVKATKKTCARCIYHQGVGSQPGKEQTNFNICCNYLAAEGHSRIFEDGKLAYDPKYCDKFKTGEKLRPGAWNRDNMTMWQHKCKEQEEYRRREYEENYWY